MASDFDRLYATALTHELSRQDSCEPITLATLERTRRLVHPAVQQALAGIIEHDCRRSRLALRWMRLAQRLRRAGDHDPAGRATDKDLTILEAVMEGVSR